MGCKCLGNFVLLNGYEPPALRNRADKLLFVLAKLSVTKNCGRAGLKIDIAYRLCSHGAKHFPIVAQSANLANIGKCAKNLWLNV